jgi:hypothetical protein
MFIIQKETNPEVIKSLGCSENELVMVARENGEITGYSNSTLSDKLYIHNIVADDPFFFDSLFRATLNYASNHSVKSAVIDNALMEKFVGMPTIPESAEIEDCEEFFKNHRLCGHG